MDNRHSSDDDFIQFAEAFQTVTDQQMTASMMDLVHKGFQSDVVLRAACSGSLAAVVALWREYGRISNRSMEQIMSDIMESVVSFMAAQEADDIAANDK